MCEMPMQSPYEKIKYLVENNSVNLGHYKTYLFK